MTRFITTIGLLLSYCSIFAQQELSLSDAIQLGLDNNFQIKISEIGIEMAKMNNNYSEAGGGPTISLLVKQENQFLNNDNPASFINGQLMTSGVTPTLNARWILFNGYRINISKSQLDLLEDQSNENASIVVENVVQGIILSYYRCLVEKKKLEVITELVRSSANRLKLAEEKKELGAFTSFDLLQIENSHLDDSTKFLLAKSNYENSVRNLNLVLGVSIDSTYVFSDFIDEAPNLGDLIGIEGIMLSDNHTLKKEYLNTQLIQNQSKLHRSALYPLVYLDAGASANVSLLAPFGTLLDDLQDDLNTNARVGLGKSYLGYVNFTLAWTLFDGKKNRRNIQEALMQLEATEYRVEDVKRTMTSDLRKAYAFYQAQKQISQVSKKKVETSKLSNELSQERWENGILNTLDYRMIQLDYLNSELLLMESYFNQWANYLELSRMTGGILKEVK